MDKKPSSPKGSPRPTLPTDVKSKPSSPKSVPRDGSPASMESKPRSAKGVRRTTSDKASSTTGTTGSSSKRDAPAIGLKYDERGYVVGPDPDMSPTKFKAQMKGVIGKKNFDHMRHLRIGTWLETEVYIKTLPEPVEKTVCVSCDASSCPIPFDGFSGKPAPRIPRDRKRGLGNLPCRKGNGGPSVVPFIQLPRLTAAEISVDITVIEGDTLAVAAQQHNELVAAGDPKGVVGVLNMACWNAPGGGYRIGAGAQEENICRRTNLIEHLKDVRYPMEIAECHYSKNVHYFRGTETDGYPMLSKETRKEFCILSAAGYNRPPLIDDPNSNVRQPEKRLDADYAAGTYLTICSVLRAGKTAGCKRLVLSALGCGAYGNPAKDVARLFAHAIKNEKYVGKIIFAILTDHRTGDENIKVFQKEFAR
eukprot:GEMP01023335.1.p1 GENE.GEMP01023335.1~~GEMP01023335.1.p1  ORF type:complete len:421 (+),score=76.39 GEMP01023335.1:150-1412(+)